MMLIPISHLLAAHFSGERAQAKLLRLVAHAAAAIMLLSSLDSAFAGLRRDESGTLNLSLALFFIEAAVFYGMVMRIEKRPQLVYVTTWMLCASLWQVLTYAGVAMQMFSTVFALFGVLLLVAYRLSFWERTGAQQLAEPFFQAANALVSLAMLSSLFKWLGDMSSNTDAVVNWSLLGFGLAMLATSFVAFAVVRHSGWRRWYLLMSLAHAAVTLLTLHHMINLNVSQQIE